MLHQTKNIQVVVHTTWWDRDAGKFGFYRGWPHNDDTDPVGSYNQILNKLEESRAKALKKRRRYVPRVAVVSLETALTNHSKCSAYFVQYKPTSMPVRLSTKLFYPHKRDFLSLFLEMCPNGIEMQLAIFDLDADSDPDKWFDQQRPRIAKLRADHPGLIVYRSKGGMRIIGVLPEVFTIKTSEDKNNWTRTYSAWIRYLAREYGLRTEGNETADALADWSRYQRVPHDTRVQGEPAADLEIIGDTSVIGTWSPDLQPEDWPAERKFVKNEEHLDYIGECQQLELVRRAGLRLEEVRAGEWDIECPNISAHGDTNDIFSKTRLFTNGPIGKIKCFSGSCSASHPEGDYRSHFNEDDVIATHPSDWRFDPGVMAVYDRMHRRQQLIEFDTPENSPLMAAQQADQARLKAAIRAAQNPSFGNPEQDREFARWFVRQSTYKNPKSPTARKAWFDSIEKT